MPSKPSRLNDIPGFGIDRVAAAVEGDSDCLRLENLDTDLAPPAGVVEATRAAVGVNEYSSYLPFTGRDDLRAAVAAHVFRRSGVRYDSASEVVITCGDGDNSNDALFATTDVGDEVILTDPTYAGMVNRVRLVGAIPRLVPMLVENNSWRLDLDALRAAVTPRTKALYMANPSFPTGARLNDEEWQAIVELCVDNDLWLLYWSMFEGIVFDNAAIVHPASFPGMRERTITIGTISMEWRMIGWRVGWLVAPAEIMSDLALAHIYNGLTPGGIGMAGALVALQTPAEELHACVKEWQYRRDIVLEQLDGLPVIPSNGTWSLLLDTHKLGLEPAELSLRLLNQKVAATPMNGWGGKVADRHLRLVYSDEPAQRLSKLGERVRRAINR